MDNPIVASIGLISDTHYQDRLFSFPAGLENWFANVDFILHAGDVGDLEILNLLGEIATTIAVHGNDEPQNVKHDLLEQQLVSVQGVRILLWHSHYPDPVIEKANRKGTWGPKLERIANRGQEVNAQVVVYGHTHVPLVYRQNGILVVNPGALAAGSYFTRQVISSVAKLQLHADGTVKASHFDLGKNQEVTVDQANLEDDFDILASQYQEWIVEPDMVSKIGQLRQIALEDDRAVIRAFVPLYKKCLVEGQMRWIDFIEAISSSALITPNDKMNILRVINTL